MIISSSSSQSNWYTSFHYLIGQCLIDRYSCNWAPIHLHIFFSKIYCGNVAGARPHTHNFYSFYVSHHQFVIASRLPHPTFIDWKWKTNDSPNAILCQIKISKLFASLLMFSATHLTIHINATNHNSHVACISQSVHFTFDKKNTYYPPIALNSLYFSNKKRRSALFHKI